MLDSETTAPISVDHGNESDISPPRGYAFPVVGVGASSGGLEAFTQLLKALPDDTGMAFVLIQHLDPHHASHLTEILASSSTMPIRTVEDGMTVSPNGVYVIPENATMCLESGALRLVNRKPGLHLPIDAFFESLASAQGSRAIAIVLSGNASDGSRGVRAIKGECGLTFAQDEGSARHYGMPRNAIATGAIDFVLPPERIAAELIHLSRHPYVRPEKTGAALPEVLPSGDGELQKIFAILQASTKVDFSHYKPNTIKRRIGRRMIVKRCGNLTEYLHVLKNDSAEIWELYRDLLISVTSFFRDPDAFASLSRHLKSLLASKPPNENFRVWVAGCATGEEVYSIAICLQELFDEAQRSTPVQLFGTDISEIALERSRAGAYPESITRDVSPERLSRFFVRANSGYQVSKALRESCVFARQDMTKDPPFGRMDLISCRNVLIYMDLTLQRLVLPVLHYSLNPAGLLFLGSAESILSGNDLFTPIDKQQRIYRRNPAALRPTLNLALHGDEQEATASKPSTPISALELQKKADRLMQTRYLPAAVVIGADLQILQFRGRTGFYLEAASGEASFHLLRMARESLAIPLRRAVEAAVKQNVSVREIGVIVAHENEQRHINLEVTPITTSSSEERYYLIVFEQTAPAALNKSFPEIAPQEGTATSSANHQARNQNQQQISELREYARSLSQEHEAHSEELRAAIEEIRSANEELQSTNEELGTTKEELQSANEELTTLNEELQNRNGELTTLNSDLANLLSAVKMPFIMVDNGLRLRRFSAAAEELLELKGSDIGSPLIGLETRLNLLDLHSSMRKVSETLAFEKFDIQDKAGRWFSVTMRPYKTVDNRIDGQVILFLDVDPLKRSLQAAEEARDLSEQMIGTVREPLLVLDTDLRIERANPAFYELFRVSREETEARHLYDLGNGQWNLPRLRELLGDALFRSAPFHDFEVAHQFPHIGHKTMRLNARYIPQPDGKARKALLAIEDVTKRQQESEARYQRLFETAKDGMLLFDAETEKLTDVNPYFLELTGYGREQMIGRRLPELSAFQANGGPPPLLSQAQAHEVVRFENVPLITRLGNLIDSEIVANRYSLGGQQTIQINLRDVTKRNQTVRALQQSEERFRLFVESVRDYALFQMDTDGRITSWNSGAERLLGYDEAEIIGRTASLLFTPEDVASGEPQKEMERASSTGRSENERWHPRKDKTTFFASGVMTSVRDEAGRLLGFAKVMQDVTDRKRSEQQLRNSLREKEVLLKEIHHRVKNNLQVIASLLSLQADHLENSRASIVMEEMQDRVRSIASIHEMLYGSSDLSRIDFGAYLNKMTEDLRSVYSAGNIAVRIDVDPDTVFLDISQAVPCGLIVNELLTNSFKHAFTDFRHGTVDISFGCANTTCELRIADNGIGLPEGLDPQSATHMGLQLLGLLVQQLKGSTEILREKGTCFLISFPHKPVDQKAGSAN